MGSCIPLILSTLIAGQVARTGAELNQGYPRDYALEQPGGVITLRILPGALTLTDQQFVQSQKRHFQPEESGLSRNNPRRGQVGSAFFLRDASKRGCKPHRLTPLFLAPA